MRPSSKAKNMLYVAESTSIPLPRLFTAYTYEPLDRDICRLRECLVGTHKVAKYIIAVNLKAANQLTNKGQLAQRTSNCTWKSSDILSSKKMTCKTK
ncbi:predicted protein [Plenodomus lingam JN3]|uniref:Uncharacterized protein n=1 Tax=Leptosphaeria maculans (strain JN3 / isolate v23.1.3 / race Av1-4-5-6-7-8) TaxID=985895 RepID=E5A6M3_LEPMJ|nr:predicted protein [Plenodomus lingam JN3]CBX99268.1 predicted protein [Plenodomus lingam JN3]